MIMQTIILFSLLITDIQIKNNNFFFFWRGKVSSCILVISETNVLITIEDRKIKINFNVCLLFLGLK